MAPNVDLVRSVVRAAQDQNGGNLALAIGKSFRPRAGADRGNASSWEAVRGPDPGELCPPEGEDVLDLTRVSNSSQPLDDRVPSYHATGRTLLDEGQVGVLMLAGGESTRMGGEPRGRLRVGLEPEQTLFALQAAKIRALNPSQPPLCLVMTSAAVHEDTVSAFEDAGYFGLPRQRVEFLQQDSLPVIPLDSLRAPHKLDPVVTDAGTYRLSPTGHGGMLAALGRHPKLIDRLAEEKVQHLYSFIYPNVLERISDPVVIGFHAAKKTDVTVKAIPAAECRPGERMGRVVRAARGIRILEYSQIDPVRDSDAVTWPASIGAQVWSVEFLRKCLRGGIELPYHVLLRPHDNPREVKLETFNFDLLPYARSVGVVLVGRDQEYSPIKEQKDLESARERVRTRYREWCESGTL